MSDASMVVETLIRSLAPAPLHLGGKKRLLLRTRQQKRYLMQSLRALSVLAKTHRDKAKVSKVDGYDSEGKIPLTLDPLV